LSLVVVHAQTARADVLSIIGEVDLITAPRLVSDAADAIRRGARAIVLDLHAVTFMDSAGLAALLNVLRRATAAGGEVVLVDLQPQVRRLLASTRVDRHFTITDTVEQAERILAAAG
jgi:anti-sigma B factor antagonist